jgi:pilus assembly protein CpaE
MQKISTLIFSNEFSTAEVIKLYLSEFDSIDVLPSVNNFEKIMETLSQTHSKSIFIVDLSEKEEETISLIEKISAQCKDCKIIALADNPTVDLIIRIMRAGAREFLPVPIIKNEFFEAVRKTIAQIEEPKHYNKCKIISIFSNKG